MRKTMKKINYMSNIRSISLFLILTMTFLSQNSFAFKPKAEFGHVGIVKDALRKITRTSSKGATLMFSERAIKEMRDSTASVDDISAELLTNPAAHCDDELLHDCTFRINSIKKAIIDNLKNDSTRNGAGARKEIGRALHTLQDFYSHSNWINVGGGVNPDIGLSLISALSLSQRTCNYTQAELAGFGLTDITTAYFPLDSFSAPEGKCIHGISILFDVTDGIHKDDPSQTGHVAARKAAVDSTVKYIEEILDAEGVQGNDLAISEFMDSGGTFGVIVDDTGSMGTEISGIRNIIANLVGAAQSDEEVTFTNYLFERYGDPDVGTPSVSKLPGPLLNSVFSLSPHGGGDCPELGQTALLRALNKAEVRSQLYFFSDATSKDSSLSGKVASLAAESKTVINYSITGSCSPIDPAYIKVAQATGGQVFVIRPNETAKLFNLILPSLKGDLEPILVVQDTNSSIVKSYDVPVDSTIEGLTFSVISDVLSTAKILRPSGAEVLATDADVTITSLTAGKIIRIVSPEVGNWNLSVSGAGDLSISVFGNSPISFNDFDIVEERGRLGHTGFFSISGKPVLSDEASTASAFITGGILTGTFELRATNNDLIQSITLDKGTIEVADDEFFGSFNLPTESFRVYVNGTNALGEAFTRAFPRVFLAQSIKITPEVPFAQLMPNNPSKIDFTVTNLGTAGTFSLSSIETIGLITSIVPRTITLATDETAIVEVTLSIPNGTTFDDDNSTGSLVVEVQNTSNRDSNNTAIVQLAVESLIRAKIDLKPGDKNNHVNINSNGVIPVAIFTTSLADGEDYDFDVNQIDLASLTLSGASVQTRGNSGKIGTFKDIDHDGDEDLLVHFHTNEMNIDLNSSSILVELEGVLSSGVSFEGEDSIKPTPNN